MKVLTVLILVVSLLHSCTNSNTKNEAYFKVTFSDEPSPKLLLPELIEVSSEGKLVILSSRFNESAEKYQTHHFLELSKRQIDSVYSFLKPITTAKTQAIADSNSIYKLNIERMHNSKRTNNYYWVSANNTELLELISYCQKLPEYSKRFAMDGSYYFNTSEVCD